MAVLRKATSDAEKPPKASPGEGKGYTSKSVLELERVINAMKKVIGTCVHVIYKGCAAVMCFSGFIFQGAR